MLLWQSIIDLWQHAIQRLRKSSDPLQMQCVNNSRVDLGPIMHWHENHSYSQF
jgi:hypothetical protein